MFGEIASPLKPEARLAMTFSYVLREYSTDVQ